MTSSGGALLEHSGNKPRATQQAALHAVRVTMGDGAPSVWQAWWLHCWSSQLAACQRLTAHSLDTICGPIRVASGSSHLSAPAQHHQPMRVRLHMTDGSGP